MTPTNETKIPANGSRLPTVEIDLIIEKSREMVENNLNSRDLCLDRRIITACLTTRNATKRTRPPRFSIIGPPKNYETFLQQIQVNPTKPLTSSPYLPIL
jgi:hypothetical protein